jgi:hypothetical protein
VVKANRSSIDESPNHKCAITIARDQCACSARPPHGSSLPGNGPVPVGLRWCDAIAAFVGAVRSASMDVVTLERRGRIAIVTLNRPAARNAMHPELIVLLARLWDELAADSDVCVGS